MEIHNNDKIVLLGREDLLDTAQNLPLEDIVQADFKITTDFSQADVVMFIDQYNKTRILKNRWGGIGLVTKVAQTRKITITIDVVDDQPDDDLNMLEPDRFNPIIKEYLEEISGRLNNVYGVHFKNVEIE